MAALTDYMEAQIVEHFLRNNALASPTTVYLALFESDPGEDASGTETAYTNYVRVPSTWAAINASGETKNAGSVSFPANGGSTVTITHAAVFDAVTSGNMLIKGALTLVKSIEISDVLAFPANALVLTLD
jgi:hypothetical protein|tara:strand:+ start:418 stop:807 length:390 start_codon:yes stop_codon:yes gene_type:complete